MTTTTEQKGLILWRWAQHREERGLKYSVTDQICFNWPSLDAKECRAVLEAFEERSRAMAKKAKRTIKAKIKSGDDMGKHPSSPKRPPKYVVKLELGHRKHLETFVDAQLARSFIDRVLGDEATRWRDEQTLTAKGGILVVQCEELEELMDMKAKPVTLPDPMPRQIEAFLRGQWPMRQDNNQALKVPKDTGKRAEAPKREAARSNGDGNHVTLQDICDKEGLEPRKVRMAMRKAKWSKPADGWVWPIKAQAEITKKIKGLFHRV